MALANELEGILIEDIGRIELIGRRIDFLFAAVGQSNVVIPIELIVRVIARVTIEFMESMIDGAGLLMQMPFPHEVTTIIKGFDQFRDGSALTIETTEIPWPTFFIGGIRYKVPDTGLSWIKSRHERSATWATPRRVIELSESQAILSKLINIRSGDFATVATKIAIAKIISQDHQHIRSLGFCPTCFFLSISEPDRERYDNAQ